MSSKGSVPFCAVRQGSSISEWPLHCSSSKYHRLLLTFMSSFLPLHFLKKQQFPWECSNFFRKAFVKKESLFPPALRKVLNLGLCVYVRWKVEIVTRRGSIELPQKDCLGGLFFFNNCSLVELQDQTAIFLLHSWSQSCFSKTCKEISWLNAFFRNN